MSQDPPKLLVVLPVFNEEASITSVVYPWFEILESEVGDFVMLAIDDGSVDETPQLLARLSDELGPRFEFRSRPNRGHGQSCIEGYREAITREIPHVFQIDSDGQCDPAYFPDFWRLRNEFDVIYGIRDRKDGVRRVIASTILRCSLRLGFGVDCADANVPYRLMNARACQDAIMEIPHDFMLANIALAVGLKRRPAIREGGVPIVFQPRFGGEPSVPFSKFALRAVELFGQLRTMEKKQPADKS